MGLEREFRERFDASAEPGRQKRLKFLEVSSQRRIFFDWRRCGLAFVVNRRGGFSPRAEVLCGPFRVTRIGATTLHNFTTSLEARNNPPPDHARRSQRQD